jgi:hypothetical protein
MTCSNYSIDILPIQVRLEPDKLIFIKSILQRHPEIINDLGFIYGLSEKLIGHSLSFQEKIIILASTATAAIPINPDIAYNLNEKASDLAFKCISDSRIIQELLSAFLLFLTDETIHNLVQKQNLVTLAISWCPPEDITRLLTIYEQLELKSSKKKINTKTSAIADILKHVNSTLNQTDAQPPKSIDSEQLMDCYLDQDLDNHDEYNLLWQVLCLNGGIERLENMYWDETIIELAKLVNSKNPALSICFLFHLNDV